MSAEQDPPANETQADYWLAVAVLLIAPDADVLDLADQHDVSPELMFERRAEMRAAAASA